MVAIWAERGRSSSMGRGVASVVGIGAMKATAQFFRDLKRFTREGVRGDAVWAVFTQESRTSRALASLTAEIGVTWSEQRRQIDSARKTKVRPVWI